MSNHKNQRCIKIYLADIQGVRSKKQGTNLKIFEIVPFGGAKGSEVELF